MPCGSLVMSAAPTSKGYPALRNRSNLWTLGRTLQLRSGWRPPDRRRQPPNMAAWPADPGRACCGTDLESCVSELHASASWHPPVSCPPSSPLPQHDIYRRLRGTTLLQPRTIRRPNMRKPSAPVETPGTRPTGAPRRRLALCGPRSTRTLCAPPPGPAVPLPRSPASHGPLKTDEGPQCRGGDNHLRSAEAHRRAIPHIRKDTQGLGRWRSVYRCASRVRTCRHRIRRRGAPCSESEPGKEGIQPLLGLVLRSNHACACMMIVCA